VTVANGAVPRGIRVAFEIIILIAPELRVITSRVLCYGQIASSEELLLNYL
jgi:hypothetical protein